MDEFVTSGFNTSRLTSPRPSGSAVAYGGKAVIRAATPVPYGGKQAARTGLTSRLRRESRHSCGLPNPSPARVGVNFSPIPL